LGYISNETGIGNGFSWIVLDCAKFEEGEQEEMPYGPQLAV
jgi:hypothetical protein